MPTTPAPFDGFDKLELLDGAVVASLIELGGAELLASLLESYEADSLRLLEELQEAERAKERERFERASHALKGSSASIGTCRLFRMAESLNEEIRGGHWPAAGWQEQLQETLRRTMSALEAENGR